MPSIKKKKEADNIRAESDALHKYSNPPRTIMTRISNIVSKPKIVVAIFIVLAMGASVHALLQKPKTYLAGGKKYTNYNDYVIYKQSYHHLIENKDLYLFYPDEHWDRFKYSPTFALFCGMFAALPDAVGLNVWNLLNALLLLFSIYFIPKLNNTQKGIILLACSMELLTSMQHEQSNALMAGLIILTFGLLERDKYLIATLCIVFSLYVKLFGIVAMALFLFYPQKWKLALYTVLWTIVLFIMPLIVLDFYHLKFLYSSWIKALSDDLCCTYGLSVLGLLHAWFKVAINKQIIVLIGSAIFLIPLLRFKEYKNYSFKLLTLSSILIWVVIFSHMSGSPNYVIAMAGVSLWFFLSDKNMPNIVLFSSALVITSLSHTDIVPYFIRKGFIEPYALKALPCILIWFKIIIDMILIKENADGTNDSRSRHIAYSQ